jgi:hypothetical protein
MSRLLACVTAVLLAGCATTRDLPAPPPADDTAVSPATPPAPAAAPTTAPSVSGEKPGPPPLALPPAADTPAITRPEPDPAPAAPTPEEPRRLTHVELAFINSERLIDIYRGMKRETVEKIMHFEHGGQAVNPQRQEWLRDGEGRIYVVLHYLTREPLRGKPLRDLNYTPVIFRDDRVTDIGRYPLKKLKRTACSMRSAAGHCTPPRAP